MMPSEIRNILYIIQEMGAIVYDNLALLPEAERERAIRLRSSAWSIFIDLLEKYLPE